MALPDDCFALDDSPLTVEAAQALIAARVTPRGGEEWVPLAAALGRVLARPLYATTPLPPFTNAALDGYAFRHPATAPLPITTRITAGQGVGALAPGTAARIFTGAALPKGADTVLMQEAARIMDGALHVPPGLAPGANTRRAGEELAMGAEALPAGRRLRAPEIGLAAALGAATLPVRPLLRVGVFSTGDELVAPGQPLGPARTHDSNRFTLMALLAALPVLVTDFGILRDDATETRRALSAAAESQDLLLTSGGVSAGEADHVRASLGRLDFWRLAVKPGRPAVMGMVAGTPLLGLPGNPVAAVVAFLHLARPLVLRLAGAEAETLPRLSAIAGFHHTKRPGRREYLRVSLRDGIAEKFPREGSAWLTSLTQSDALAELPEALELVRPGDALRLLPFQGIF
ncbi:molybdopterin molybdotransferase MoeA [Roseococcus suduntuyensis]|uniref:Molybdopterin molybdenumtransferase n=1 Tax=Roseococcus suduntuyensis TaxID=455361 RepID=A0A840AHL2_9PROT|nr:gephyrin-like molybdotransferase Glp [Roseococcus suduntuyensis]MBB3900352.1 molybdopterin molybdotransferase [Roseococcus suduntuyensis]